MDDGVNLTEIIPGAPICKESAGNWPELDESGTWGVMVDNDISDGGFEYATEYFGGQAVCTKYGCKFDE